MAEFGEILKHVGELGRFQILLVVMLRFLSVFNAFHMFGQVFLGISVPHHCNTRWILEKNPNLTEENRLNLTIPRNAQGSYEQCLMYSPVDWDVESIERYGLNNTEVCRDGWVYGTSQQKSTLVSEFNLVCHRRGQKYILQSVYMAGLLIGSIISGTIGDWILPESPRWLLIRGKNEQAKKLLQRAAAMNKKTLSEEILKQLQEEKQAKTGNMLDLFRIAALRRITLIISFVWFANNLVFYGLGLNVGSFGVDIYLTQFIFGAVDIPAHLGSMLTVQLLGRKLSQSIYLFLAGIVCLIVAAIPKSLTVARTVLAVIGKLASAASMSSSYAYTPELFPTVIRQNGVGVCGLTGRTAGIIAPLISILGDYHSAIPMAVFGSVPIIGSLLCFFLPETRNRDLPDLPNENNNIPRSNVKPQENPIQDNHPKQELDTKQEDKTTKF